MIVVSMNMICSTENGLMYVSYKSTSCGRIGSAHANLCHTQNLNIHE